MHLNDKIHDRLIELFQNLGRRAGYYQLESITEDLVGHLTSDSLSAVLADLNEKEEESPFFKAAEDLLKRKKADGLTNAKLRKEWTNVSSSD